MQETDKHKEIVLDFIKSQKLAALATADTSGKPEVATVAISEKDTLELIFGCYASARKYQNLLHNNRVAVVFNEGKVSVQYEGVAAEVQGGETEKLQEIHISKHAGSAKYLSHPAEKYFKIIPSWIRYMDHAAKPDVEFEIKF